MDQEEKRVLRKMACAAVAKTAESLLRWRDRKDRTQIPEDPILVCRSERLGHEARQIMTKRTKKIWKAFKEAYQKGWREGG